MAATILTMAAAAVVSPVTQVSFGRVKSMKVHPGSSMLSVCRAAPMKGSSGPAIDSTGDKVADKIEAAQDACAGNDQTEECVTAWDEVESAQKEKASSGSTDPLEEYCADNPEADECRVYKD